MKPRIHVEEQQPQRGRGVGWDRAPGPGVQRLRVVAKKSQNATRAHAPGRAELALNGGCCIKPSRKRCCAIAEMAARAIACDEVGAGAPPTAESLRMWLDPHLSPRTSLVNSFGGQNSPGHQVQSAVSSSCPWEPGSWGSISLGHQVLSKNS